MAQAYETQSPDAGIVFDFGKNWENYSNMFLTAKEIAAAENSLKIAFGMDRFAGKSFLDVGCGTGIFSIAAGRLGAGPVVGIDINRRCTAVAKSNAARFSGDGRLPDFKTRSALDSASISALGRFDYVYAWGVLHHTGNMLDALSNVMRCVSPGGYMCIAIYNRHLTSPLWKLIKVAYNRSTDAHKRLWIKFFYPILFLAKRLITGENPLKMRRGMDFYHDVIDWIGGYPYEYADRQQIVSFVEPHGFRLIRFVPTQLPTGNNEYLFARQ